MQETESHSYFVIHWINSTDIWTWRQHLNVVVCWRAASCYRKVAGSIPLICMSKCPWARCWTPHGSWCAGRQLAWQPPPSIYECMNYFKSHWDVNVLNVMWLWPSDGSKYQYIPLKCRGVEMKRVEEKSEYIFGKSESSLRIALEEKSESI